MHEEDKKSVNNMGWEGMKNQSRLTRVPLVIIVKWMGNVVWYRTVGIPAPKKNIHVSLYNFLSHSLRNEWIRAIQKSVGFKQDFCDGDELAEKNCVCGDHFTVENYRMHRKSSVRLKCDAISNKWPTERTCQFFPPFFLFTDKETKKCNVILFY